MYRQKLTAITCATFLLVCAGQANANLITNGDFETGTFASWTASQAGGSVQEVIADPGDPTLGSSPTSDFYAFAGNQIEPSLNVLTQSFVVPTVTLSQAIFSFDYAYQNFGFDFVDPTPDTLVFDSANNQQLRVEILNGGAVFDTVNPAEIVFSALQSAPGDAAVQAWTSYSQDIASVLNSYLGQTLQVRIAQVDNQGPFDIGFDNIDIVASTNPSSVPEPSSLAILGIGLGLMTIRRRRSN